MLNLRSSTVCFRALAFLAAALLFVVPVFVVPARGQDLSEAARWLQGYLRLDTTNPPGNEFLAAGYLAGILHREGIASRLLVTPEGRTSLYARLPATVPAAERRPAVLLMHHMDVVPAGEGWSFEPFSGRLRDGYLEGRGAVDVKSLGIAHLAALVELVREGVERDRDVIFLGVADEENGGGRGTAWLLEHRPELFEQVGLVLNEGGANRHVNGRLLWWGVEVAQKRPLWLRITARGRAGHASGYHPRSAAHRLIRGLDRLLALPTEFRVTEGVRIYLRALAPLHQPPYSDRFANIDRVIGPDGPKESLYPGMAGMFLDTVQVTVLEGSERINSIPATASADVDVRLLPDTDADAFLKKVRDALGDDLSVKVLVASPPAGPSPVDHELFAVLEERLGQVAPVVPVFISGFTDSRYFRQRGIPAYGFSPFALEPQDLLGIHNVDERIRVDAFDLGVQRSNDVLRALVRRKSP
ncbi:MAG: M20/M25/M40 family metallo-hydrolase [Acidobacteriota bacterium]|nr:M20/M25/M40 family metallo-hydrolase [Acidobacteriota bacterium]